MNYVTHLNNTHGLSYKLQPNELEKIILNQLEPKFVELKKKIVLIKNRGGTNKLCHKVHDLIVTMERGFL